MTVLSGSSVANYEDCHLAWYFEYVEARDARSEAMDLGQEVHDYAEWALKVATGEYGTDGRVVTDEARRLIEVFRRDIMPTYGEVLLVEAGFELDVEGVTYTGYIDAVDVHVEEALVPSEFDGRPVMDDRSTYQPIVRDLKTSKNRPRPGKYRDQLVGYYLGARALGHRADLLRLDYIVKTKQAYYWPEDQPVPDDDEIDLWAAKVVRVHRSIEEGDFEPTALGTYKCAGCSFKGICGPYERYQDLTSPIRKDAR